MKHILKIALLIATVACGTGCTTGYWIDRGADLTDVAHVDMHGWSLGAAVNVGPAIVGYHSIFDDRSGGTRDMFGLGGHQQSESDGTTSGLIIPFGWRKEECRSESFYKRHSPTLGSIGFDMGLVVGIGARIDFVELIDLILGFCGVDILNDDLERKKQKIEQEDDNPVGPNP